MIMGYTVEPLNTDTPEIWTLSCVPIVAILYKTTLEIMTHWSQWCPQ